ncbi:hypothetical protein BCR36DRAFT_579859 [Piromyces finnis]|uniref:Uncharacterized protein n=1 Tax=Piromyces finnis TaxID=1754191 RepID=A0A1Y1VLD1_9FUNG|nr:hypothetical protein BCR36DRAFT_579859 [Piromyces finnis]|eukprot:ORX59271.1 hypothetical protein BCR36DRAFT_579859 [Piromyces finnis]
MVYSYNKKGEKKETGNAHNKLNTSQKKELNKYFNKKNLLVRKKQLKNAVRKYISRYLINDRFTHFEWNLVEMMVQKEELWDDDIISKEDQFNNEIDELKKLNISIGQSLDLFNFLDQGKKR